MNVVHVSTSDMGGAGIAAKRLHEGMLASGVSSSLLTLYKLGKQTERHFVIQPDQEESKLTFTERVKMSLRYRFPFFFQDKLEAFYSMKPKNYDHFSFPFSDVRLDEHELIRSADIVHLHWVSDGLLDYSSFFKNCNKKIVWTLHDMNPFTGGCHHADDSDGFMNKCLDCPQIKGTNDEQAASRNLKLKIEALSAIGQNQLCVITPSEWLGNLAGRSRVLGKFPRMVIPNVVPENVFKVTDKKQVRVKWGIPPDANVILFVANDVTNQRKGINELLEVINQINDPALFVCTVGKKVNEAGLNKRIKQFGFVTYEPDVAELYASADVFVLPSHAENFPNTIVESLLCGVPVAASNVGGIPEQVGISNGSLFPVGNKEALRLSLENILTKKLEFHPHKLREDALEKYNTHKVVSSHIELYLEMLAKND